MGRAGNPALLPSSLPPSRVRGLGKGASETMATGECKGDPEGREGKVPEDKPSGAVDVKV